MYLLKVLRGNKFRFILVARILVFSFVFSLFNYYDLSYKNNELGNNIIHDYNDESMLLKNQVPNNTGLVSNVLFEGDGNTNNLPDKLYQKINSELENDDIKVNLPGINVIKPNIVELINNEINIECYSVQGINNHYYSAQEEQPKSISGSSISLIASVVSGTAILLTWNNPFDEGFNINFDIYINNSYYDTVSNCIEYTLLTLPQDTEIMVFVEAKDEFGNLLVKSNIITTGIFIESPTINLVSVTGSAIEITWSEIPFADGYEISINSEVIFVDNNSSYLLYDYLFNNNYEFKIRAIKGNYISKWSEPFYIKTAPAKILNLSARVKNDTSIEIKWDSVKDINKYEVEINDTSVIVNASSYIYSIIRNVKQYKVRVRAISGEEKGLWSDYFYISSATNIKGGIINEDTIWDCSGGVYFIEGNVIIPEGVTLTIKEGVTVKFYKGTALFVSGKLIARGNEHDRITLIGNGYYEYSDMYGIIIENTGEFNGEYLNVKNGGYYSNNLRSWLYVSGKLSLKNSEIYYSYGNGIVIDTRELIHIENNIISNSLFNGIEIRFSNPAHVTLKGNKIENNKGFPIKITDKENPSVVQKITEDNVFQNNAETDSIYLIGGNLGNTILPAFNYVLIENIFIPENERLVIKAGTTLKLFQRICIEVQGKLICEGEINKEIVFTSILDNGYSHIDSERYWAGVDIDTKGEFVASNIIIKYSGGVKGNSYTAPGVINVKGKLSLIDSKLLNSRRGININSSEDIVIRNVIIERVNGAVWIDNPLNNYGSILIENCVFRNNLRAIYVTGQGTKEVIIRNNKFYNNGFQPICLSGEKSINVLRTITDDNIFSGNEENVISVDCGLIGNFTLLSDYVYIIGGKITIPIDETFNIEPGTVMRFIANGCFDVYGKLIAEGTADKEIVFTSIEDKKYGGSGSIWYNDWDEYGYWNGIRINTSGEFIGNHIKVTYSGEDRDIYNINGAIEVRGKLNLRNSEISNSMSQGIYFNTDYQPILYHNTFKKNRIGIYNSKNNYLIDARYNYWNSIFGPKTYKCGNQGLGDIILGDIAYEPYLGYETVSALRFNKEHVASSGNYSYNNTDLQVKCLDGFVMFNRLYNSQDNEFEGILGSGWYFSFESRLTNYEFYDSQITKVRLPDGSIDIFNSSTDSKFTSISSRNVLEKLADGTYTLKTTDQIVYCFNNIGLLKWINKDGNKLSITHDINGYPTKIIDYVGRQYDLDYDNNLLQSIRDPLGRRVQYLYEGNKLIGVINAEGVTTYYNYDDKGYLSEILDGNYNVIELITYKTTNGVIKVASIVDRYGNKKDYSYDEINNKIIISDQNGRLSTKWYDITYNTTKTIDAEGRSTTVDYYLDDNVNRFNETRSINNRFGNVTNFERDQRGNYTKIINPDGSYKLYTYDTKNNLTSECDENGKYTFYIYDETETYLLKIAKPLNGTDRYSEISDPSLFTITTYSYYKLGENGYGISGLVKSVQDPEDNITTYTYDQFGNVKTITDNKLDTTYYEFNSIGLLMNTLSPEGELTKYTYDNYGNLKTKVLDGGETTLIVYDNLGRKVQELTPNIYAVSQSGDVGYRYTYNNNGLVSSITDPLDNTTSYTYDLYGNKLTETKPNGCIYSYDYDVLNRVTKEYIRETASSNLTLLKSYSYSVLSERKTQKSETVYLNSSETAITTYIYDYADRLVKQTNPDGGIINTVYNSNGTIYSESDAKGKPTYYRYDGLNRITEKWSPFEDGKYTYHAFSYDKNSNIIIESISVEPLALWVKSSNNLTTCYEYDDNNQLIKVINPAGDSTEYDYDKNGNKTKETIYIDATKSKVTEYEYNHLGKISTMISTVDAGDIYGNDIKDISKIQLITQYSYDANGNNIKQILPNGKIIIYNYDWLNRLSSQEMQGIDENGNAANISTTYTYDYAGNVLSTTDPNGNITIHSYNQRGLLVQTLNSENGITLYYYDNAGRLTNKVMPKNYKIGASLSDMSRAVFTYDKMNRIILEQAIYFDNKTQAFRTINAKAYQYDLNGNKIKELDALGYNNGYGTTILDRIKNGYGTTYSYNDANLLITSLSPASKDLSANFDIKYMYDGAGRKMSETNANGFVTKYYYDGAGRITKKTIIDGTEKVLQQFSYDGLGNVVTQSDAYGNLINYTYNKLGLMKSQINVGDSTIDSYSFENQYDEIGQLVHQADSMGKVISYIYNQSGQVLRQTEMNKDGSQTRTIRKAYDKNGNLRFSTDANHVRTQYTYDKNNRLTQTELSVSGRKHLTVIDYDGNGNLIKTTDWLGNNYINGYDDLNRLIKKTDPYGKTIEIYEYNDNNAQVKAYDALGNITTFVYDKNNRLLSTTDQAGYTTSQTYDKLGNVATKKDGKNNITIFAYDALNRLAKVTNAKGENTGYTYDLNGNMLTKEDAKSNIVTYTYNTANLMVTKTVSNNEISLSENYTYYGNKNLKTKSDLNGNICEYLYDIHGNLLNKSIDSYKIEYSYDGNGNVLEVRNSADTTIRTYDELGRVLTKTVSNIGTIKYTYDITTNVDKGCNKEKSIDPFGNVTEKIFDKAGRLSEVLTGDGSTIYTYYDNGNRASVIYSNGFKEEYTYYPNNTMKSVKNIKPDGSIMDSYSYTYDSVGNQLTKSETVNGVSKGTTTYTYDALNRLLSVKEPNGRQTSYTYDGAGNRLTETILQNGSTTLNIYAYNGINRLTDITTKVNNVLKNLTKYSYDNNGNALSSTNHIYNIGEEKSDTVSYEYDVWNQLVKTNTVDGTFVENSYNGEGYRVGKKVNSDQVYYLYEMDKVILEVDKECNQLAKNVYGTNLLIRSIDDENYYYMYNGHADVVALVSNKGVIAATYYYDAFGNILERTGDVYNNILYKGYQYDKETELYYLNARMYDPKIARFLQEDTYTGDPKDPLSLNLYTYCSNNPIIYWDPSGHRAVETGESGGGLYYKSLNSKYWNRSDGYFTDYWWQNDEKLKEAIKTLRQEVKDVGPLNVNKLVSQYKYDEDNKRMKTLQVIVCAERTGVYDDGTLSQIENSLTKKGIDYSEKNHTIDLRTFDALVDRYKENPYKKSGYWLEKGGGQMIDGLLLLGGATIAIKGSNANNSVKSNNYDDLIDADIAASNKASQNSSLNSQGAGKTVNNSIEVKDGVRFINGNKAIINVEKQVRHLPDTVQGTRSYLTTDAQKLLDKVGGTGDFVQLHKEVVNVGSNVGKYVDQVTGVAVDTTRVTIHYSKTGVHIVPAPPLR